MNYKSCWPQTWDLILYSQSFYSVWWGQRAGRSFISKKIPQAGTDWSFASCNTPTTFVLGEKMSLESNNVKICPVLSRLRSLWHHALSWLLTGSCPPDIHRTWSPLECTRSYHRVRLRLSCVSDGSISCLSLLLYGIRVASMHGRSILLERPYAIK